MHGGMHEKPRTKAALSTKRRGREEQNRIYSPICAKFTRF